MCGYLIVMNSEDIQVKAQMTQHQEELMEDMDPCGWERVCDYHGAWLNQLEQGRCTWGDVEHKLKMR